MIGDLTRDEAIAVLRLIRDSYSCMDDCAENMIAIARVALGEPLQDGSWRAGAQVGYVALLRDAGIAVP